MTTWVMTVMVHQNKNADGKILILRELSVDGGLKKGMTMALATYER